MLVHRQFRDHWAELAARVGLQQAQQFWDHVSHNPGQRDPIAQITILKGKAGKSMGPNWSRTYHYEVSGAGRIDYQFNEAFKTSPSGDAHRVVAIRTISFGSH
ncbi:hypothetical protein E3T55_18805 [Cryobacterium frigoriphilum]|uniref:Uncharacterized protein n=1 Tax=Cryobacterium frigoriphilum TaxID=1259150 RepID=A0A4R8ZU01_9MICO|nr:hypothetical protein [Cryobacterium frigoriphilum]TFD45386.1 hypothetical protein E3T55_18805 [Cryobacterium frigoriphilum]